MFYRKVVGIVSDKSTGFVNNERKTISVEKTHVLLGNWTLVFDLGVKDAMSSKNCRMGID